VKAWTLELEEFEEQLKPWIEVSGPGPELGVLANVHSRLSASFRLIAQPGYLQWFL
jgi:hypothetical protein